MDEWFVSAQVPFLLAKLWASVLSGATTMPDIPDGIIMTPEGFYVLKNDTHLSRWVEDQKRLDVASGEIDLFAKHIPLKGVVVDAGACLGDHTYTYAQLVGPEGQVWSFEPNPLTFECLRRNFSQYERVKCLNLALGHKFSHMKFAPVENAGASHLSPNGSIDVRCVPLDTFFGDFERLDLIHFDLEGFEGPALMGAVMLLRKFKPVLVLEVNRVCLGRFGPDGDHREPEAQLMKLIDDLGYLWEELTADASHTQRDIICYPR